MSVLNQGCNSLLSKHKCGIKLTFPKKPLKNFLSWRNRGTSRVLLLYGLNVPGFHTKTHRQKLGKGQSGRGGSENFRVIHTRSDMKMQGNTLYGLRIHGKNEKKSEPVPMQSNVLVQYFLFIFKTEIIQIWQQRKKSGHTGLVRSAF